MSFDYLHIVPTLPGTARHMVPEAKRVGGQVCAVRQCGVQFREDEEVRQCLSDRISSQLSWMRVLHPHKKVLW